VRHVVGKSGAGINKLREELGVRVDFGEQAAGKKTATSKVTIKGRKENAEEAQRRIRSLATRMADETTLSLPLPSSLDRGSLIGKQGTYLKRLEEKYDVRINFPRDGRKADDASSSAPSTPSSSEITIRGPSKGAKAAQGELVALIEYEKEHGNTSVFEVPVKALPRILGRGGAQINQIKDDTGVASVDVDQKSQEATTATITLRGTKSAIKKAREAIEAIANEVQDELRLELDIPREYHMTLIGSGGSNIRELIARCGGPSDARASGNTVRFPRQGDERQTVTITAPSAVATKIKEALEAEVASLASRVTWGVVVPNQNHAAVIGKGAQSLRDLQRKHGVKVIMPGWDEYATSAAPENQDELAEADERDIVKVLGPKEAVIAAAADLQAVKGRGGASGASTPAAHSVEVIVPRRLHAQVAQGGRFFRSLPSGTRVSHRGVKPPSSALKSRKPPAPPAANGTPALAGRIDDEVDASNGVGEETGLQFQLVPLLDAADATGEDADETIPWVVESRSQEDAEQVAEEIRRTLAKAQEASHVGWVTVPQGLMPRIVGRGGAGLDRLRATGVDVEVVGKRDANQLTLTGSPSAIDAAYDIIRELNAPRPPRRQRDQDYENDY
jgi:predicted PilT family ATPase